MSDMLNGSTPLFIGAPDPKTKKPRTQTWNVTHTSGGWQGCELDEPQPLSTNASMSYSAGSVSLNSDGTYTYTMSITNHGPNSTFFNLQSTNN
jgi:hypothetical protein